MVLNVNYTYDDVMNTAKKYGFSLTANDKTLAQRNPDAGMTILNYQHDYKTATTDEAKALAHYRANQIRSQYGGYQAAGDGTGYHLDDISPSSFTYDPEQDAAYQSYRTQYLREGGRASKNAVADAAKLTGGIASSYAVTAGAQAGQAYADKLADKENELRDAAYEKFVDELNYKKQLESEAYARSQDAYERARDAAAEKLDLAKLAASIGDYSLLEELGYDTQTLREQNARDAAAFYSKSQASEELRDAISRIGKGDYTYEDLLYLRDKGFASLFKKAGYNLDQMIGDIRQANIPPYLLKNNNIVKKFQP